MANVEKSLTQLAISDNFSPIKVPTIIHVCFGFVSSRSVIGPEDSSHPLP